MRWSENETLEFVKLYVKHECLWNPEHPAYKLKFQRTKAYNEICKDFKANTNRNLSTPEVKMKIKNLRTTYMQQVQKILQKASPDYEPTLIWFHEMDRCLKHVPVNKHNVSSDVFQTQDTTEVDSSCQVWVDGDNNQDFTDEDSEPIQPAQTYSKIKREKNTSPVPYKKIKKKKSKGRSSKPVREYSSETNSDNGNDDEFDIYGKHVASQLRRLDLQKALRLQLEIQNLISDARISQIDG